MAYSRIIITQGAGVGTAGKSRRDLDLFAVASEAIVLSNDPSGSLDIASYEWTLVEKPPGSVATMLTPTATTASFQPDVYGRYVVALRVNGLGDNTSGYARLVCGCEYPSLGVLASGDDLGDWLAPAHDEGDDANWDNFFGASNEKGAQAELWRIIDQIRLYGMTAASSGLYHNNYAAFIASFPSGLTQRTDSAAWADSAIYQLIDIANYPWVTSVKFFATYLRDGVAGQAEIRLYDETNVVAITGSDLVDSSAAIIDDLSGALTIGNGAGEIRNDGLTRYKVQTRITAGTPLVDYASLYVAGILLI